MVDEVAFTPIAYIQSCYPERFGIPRQAGLVDSAHADIVFEATEENKLALRGIDEFSHLWVLFFFHGQTYGDFKPLVRPPRLGGNKNIGVYATRSPNRPNPIGMSAVKFLGITQKKRILQLRVQGGDFLDGTPVIDIKPYVPYVDALPQASSAWATYQEPPLTVCWSDSADAVLLSDPDPEGIRCLITETLAQDPRPGYERGKDGKPRQRWNMRIRHYSVFWVVHNGIAEITQLIKVDR